MLYPAMLGRPDWQRIEQSQRRCTFSWTRRFFMMPISVSNWARCVMMDCSAASALCLMIFSFSAAASALMVSCNAKCYHHC